MTQELFPDPFSLLPPIFRDCVDSDSLRFCLEFPQPVDGFACATDGRIFVRMPLTPEIAATLPDISPKKFPASGVELFATRDKWEVEPTPLPSLEPLARCQECEGAGHRPERRCTGVCDYDDLSPCRGKGTIPAGPCYDCDGTGIQRPGSEFLKLRDDVRLAAYYLYILAKHGATLYLPAEPNTWGSVRPVYFTVEGGVEGVLMPAALDKPERKPRKTGATSSVVVEGQASS